jgi:Fe-S cluster biogenesis protein NfuA
VRPYLIADGGNVEVVLVENGIIGVRLQGACGTCPSSTGTHQTVMWSFHAFLLCIPLIHKPFLHRYLFI